MTLVLEDDWLQIHHGDARAVLAALEPESVQTVITSPPYWSLRDYGVASTIWGGEPDHDHEWAATARTSGGVYLGKTRWQHNVNGRDEPQPGDRRQRVQMRVAGHPDIPTGSYCPCGAWYGVLGLEPTPDQYVANVVALFREVRRVLRSDGTLWLNIGDSYSDRANRRSDGASFRADRADVVPPKVNTIGGAWSLKAKDRMMMPARVAIALQEDGWWLRDEIVWAKTNPMPSSVDDRTTPAHEMVYLLSKRGRYHYDADAIREAPGQDTHSRGGRDVPANWNHIAEIPGSGSGARTGANNGRVKVPGGWEVEPGAHGTIHRSGRTRATYRESTLPGRVNASTERTMVGANARTHPTDDAGERIETGRNKRSVWTIATQPYPEAHFATFPEKLVEPMVLAGCPPGGVVLDPFGGSGTTAMVANRLGRKAVLIDLSEEYLAQAIARIATARGAGDGPAIDMPVPYANDGLWGEAVS